MKLIFSRNNSFSSLRTQLFTWCRWSHVAVMLDDGRVVDSMGGHGVRYPRSYKSYAEGFPDHVVIPLPNHWKPLKDAWVPFASLPWDYDYNTWLSRLFYPFSFRKKNTISCANFASYVAGATPYGFFDILSPADLYRMIYE